jgi:hypothetical protein
LIAVALIAQTAPLEDITDRLRHLTSKEVMKVINCSKNQLTKLVRNGEIIVFKKGKFSYSFPPEQFTSDYIRKKAQEKRAANSLGLKKGIRS